jgi:hypothetical protein
LRRLMEESDKRVNEERKELYKGRGRRRSTFLQTAGELITAVRRRSSTGTGSSVPVTSMGGTTATVANAAATVAAVN